jgi:UDP-N-acetylmuramoyl-tripeptide--D-alanyl-D-alanine ligase
MMEIKDLYARFLESGTVSTDTRQIGAGSIFFALKGEKFNANTFANEALEKGALYAVVDEKEFAVSKQHIYVNDVLETLQELARYHRDQLKIPVIGLTGSNGKTTSKELLHAVLSTKFKTLATKGNLNNHIGVPLTLLSIDNSVEIAVVEMGANHLGEIALLCTMANPSHGFITNIGRAHIGLFGGYENIIRAKSELYQHLINIGGTVFINSQNEILANMAKRFKAPVFYPSKGDFYSGMLISSDPFLKIEAENRDQIQTNLIGAYNFENVMAALCIGKYFGIDASAANQAVAKYAPGNMRSQMIQKGKNRIILDAYNANPSSMRAAIENLAAMNAKHKVLILGDMYELEGEAENEHRAIGRLIQEKKFEDIYICGKLFKSAIAEVPSAKYFESKTELINDLKTHPVTNATILVKASRGIGLETIVDYL